MASTKQIKTALISVFHKDGLDALLEKLNKEGVKFLSTGGTQQFIESLGYECQKVEDVTTYPSILGGRVKTLHPKIFGGILARRNFEGDQKQMRSMIFLRLTWLLLTFIHLNKRLPVAPVSRTSSKRLISVAFPYSCGAKNFNDVVIVPSKAEFPVLLQLLNTKGP